jgi:hypothetical protein
LNKLANAALKADDIEKASSYANESLTEAQKYLDDRNYGNAIHYGNIVLGLIALRQGDLKQAGEYLLKAGKTTGSPQLDSFGPDMGLAKGLLEKGQREIVLQYFELCRKFWNDERLNAWTEEVKAKKIPDFKANLSY